jgi:RNA polymerase sigma-70 factor (ECF subfamily)
MRGEFPLSLVFIDSYEGTSIPAIKNRASIVPIIGAHHSEASSAQEGRRTAGREASMLERGQPSNFERDVLPHLDAAYNLARWLMRNEQDAQDMVQEAYLRAFRFFPGFRCGNARAWLMKIVRNTCFTWLHANRPLQDAAEIDDNFSPPDYHAPNPEELLLQNDRGALLRKALENLPASLREVLILREIEGMSYREIADITGVPLGTVMSSLSRARGRLRQALTSVGNVNKSGGSRRTAAASA